MSEPRSEVVELATRYYDAFRTGALDEACNVVAEKLLPSHEIVGLNVHGDEDAPSTLPRRPRGLHGCATVRWRRKGWEEPIPRERWRVDDVFLDEESMRARVDTAGEGTYWMRRIDGSWRIVGFGGLTDDGVRELGGRWSLDPYR
jgi:hypothetical protein